MTNRKGVVDSRGSRRAGGRNWEDAIGGTENLGELRWELLWRPRRLRLGEAGALSPGHCPRLAADRDPLFSSPPSSGASTKRTVAGRVGFEDGREKRPGDVEESDGGKRGKSDRFVFISADTLFPPRDRSVRPPIFVCVTKQREEERSPYGRERESHAREHGASSNPRGPPF